MIVIKELNLETSKYINKCNDFFEITSVYDIEFINGKFELTEKNVIPYKKKYDDTEINTDDFINNPLKKILFAFTDNEIAGQVILRKHWNNYVWLEISLREKFRRQGIGKMLIESSVNWSKEKGFPGLIVETQNNNVPACKFYKSCAFIPGGFDTKLYSGIEKENNEIAMYWYYIF